MNDVKFYEFLLKLTTYLKHTNVLADKFAVQEKEIGECILNIKHILPSDVFNEIFVPLAQKFEDRLVIMDEIREANDEFENLLREYYEYFKGIVQ